jgi:hypothetical protein
MDGSIGTITVCNESYSDDCITIMDRNLWASEAWTWSASYWDYYKWWNNTWYSSSVSNADFVAAPTWTWTEWDQWPCPSGYHVPAIAEWSGLMNMWAGTDVWWYMEWLPFWQYNIVQFKSDFKIPFAGRRVSYGGSVKDQGSNVYIWSSSASSNNAQFFYMTNIDTNLSHDGRALGHSVRCFRDTAQTASAEWSGSTSNWETAHIHVTVSGWLVTIGTNTGVSWTLNKNLGELNISNNAQTITGDFWANAFWIEDMKWIESGYYTTLSVSDMIWESNSWHIIPKANIQLKPSGVTKISWAEVLESKVILWDSWNDWTNYTWTWNETTVTYFNRQNTATADAGRVGRWWDNLQIKVTVPAHTVADTYKGTITYTLYDLDQ